jgi:DNA-directed RNA polymerase beta subunit
MALCVCVCVRARSDLPCHNDSLLFLGRSLHACTPVLCVCVRLRLRAPADSHAGVGVGGQGGYFVINGSEKVLIAQERMAQNNVYVFTRKQPFKFSYTAEIRSQSRSATRVGSKVLLGMLSRHGQAAAAGGKEESAAAAAAADRSIVVSLPYLRTEIPIVVLFRGTRPS